MDVPSERAACDLDQTSPRTARIDKQDLEDEVAKLEEALERATVISPPQEGSAELGAIVSLLHEETHEPACDKLVSGVDGSPPPEW